MTGGPPFLQSPKKPCNTWHGHPLFSMENIYRAYRACRRRKRNTHNALAFEYNLEENLLELQTELENGTYKAGRFVVFMVSKPKRREIFAAGFRDRVVHHILVHHLESYWEKRFIHDSYACRKGKGTHSAVDRLQSFTRKTTKNNTRKAYYLQLDIKGYFVTLNKSILCRQLLTREQDPAVKWLVNTVLNSDPTQQCVFRDSKRTDYLVLPEHKTLFKTPKGCGLPIGNYTSQLFANIYLDELDQFVKHQLKTKYYIRYCDDFILLHESIDQLKAWRTDIELFIQDRLNLTMNPKEKLEAVQGGIDFLGYIVRPTHRLVRRRVVGALKEKLKQVENQLVEKGMLMTIQGQSVFPWPGKLLGRLIQSLQSYNAHFERASSYSLMQSLFKRFNWLSEYVTNVGGGIRSRFPKPTPFMRYKDQVRWFMRIFQNHVLVIQMGNFWSVCFPNDIRQPQYIPNRTIGMLKQQLMTTDHPVAWIYETGYRTTKIAERVLFSRWQPVLNDETQHLL